MAEYPLPGKNAEPSAINTFLGAAIAAAIGYAEGGKLAAILGGWQVICWALVMVFPCYYSEKLVGDRIGYVISFLSSN